ncbi:FdhF/YdeP family oxidoreductase [Photobacterium damselae]|uniref:FdhF/YdeP family oxidoreductase n=1 Tax=Photobacterium damselae TaxID=38293 RepID=UPI0020900F14|nr:FdhF/YdeP family oxidoreductase [Photobacterium damselae]USR75899.1 FdhF/YdeP family oxidoreductase [Photobacterium damselae]
MKKIKEYDHPAAGWGAVRAIANTLRKQMNIRHDIIALHDMNKSKGFDCPGCAWPDPCHTGSFEICENGAKAVAWEATSKKVTPDFFKKNKVKDLLNWSDYDLEYSGRITSPLKYNHKTDTYDEIKWDIAFKEIGRILKKTSPNEVEFYTSGRTSNEAAFLYQLFAREYGTNNFPDCSNMCHEPTSVGLSKSIGVGKGTVSLNDFDLCDLIICIGHNPGTNHPRMLTSLRSAVLRGAKIIAINPMQEKGLEEFIAPQNPYEMLTEHSTKLASSYFHVRVGGDSLLLIGIMKALIDMDDNSSENNILDSDFIRNHTTGFNELLSCINQYNWDEIEEISGIDRFKIYEIARMYSESQRTIICYGVGITQHKYGTNNVQQLMNLLLLKGNIGKDGSGICPLRGHSNVQGNRTVGITEKPSIDFLKKIEERFGFIPPKDKGHSAVDSIQSIYKGDSKGLICLGGNFLIAMPDIETISNAIKELPLIVNIATKLNRSHLITGKNSYILPVLGRTEADWQENGFQEITVEDSMSMVHSSKGVLTPISSNIKSECYIVAEMAKATLPKSKVDWDLMIFDYSNIRDAISTIFPDFYDYNRRIKNPGGFHLPNAASERKWKTDNKKANFIISKNKLNLSITNNKNNLILSTIRSHDQYNTTIYGHNDRYRGVFGQRDIAFISKIEAEKWGIENGDRVDIVALNEDGTKSSRRLNNIKIIFYNMADSSIMTYFPEANNLLTINDFEKESGIPSYKNIIVTLEV